MRRAAVLADRDGTLCEDPGYLHEPEQVRLLPGVGDAIAQLNRLHIPVVVVTNQSGIARGFYTPEQFRQVQARLEELLAQHGARLDGVYHCPHHPEGAVAAYRLQCDCRKPAPGMLRRAAAEHGFDLACSYLIGDQDSDVAAGAAAGCYTILIRDRRVYRPTGAGQPDAVARSFSEAVARVLECLAENGLALREE